MNSRDERRQYPRLTRLQWQGSVQARIRPGHDVLVLDLSRMGALVESGRRLAPGSTADVLIEALGTRHLTRALVVRSYVCALVPDLVLFRAALQLDRPVPWMNNEGRRFVELAGLCPSGTLADASAASG